MKKGKLFPYLMLLYLLLLTGFSAAAQLNDSVGNHLKADTSIKLHSTTNILSQSSKLTAFEIFDSLVRNSKIMSHEISESIHLEETSKSSKSTELIFYILFFLAVFLGLLKTIFNRYFNNMLRVFFNTSLRQSQLTEQLLQAQLPMWLFNLYFYLIAGLYAFSILIENNRVQLNQTLTLVTLMITFMLIYVIKSATIFLFGWILGFKRDAQLYNFIVTLTNQLLSILLLPILFFISFSEGTIHQIFLEFSYILIVLSFLFRYFRIYGNIRHQVNIGSFHFIIYIVGVEMLPLLLIYKFAEHFLRNYL